MLYQAFFCLFFELAKNEEGPELDFFDSLNLYKKEGREVHSHVFYIMAASLVSLTFLSQKSWFPTLLSSWKRATAS